MSEAVATRTGRRAETGRVAALDFARGVLLLVSVVGGAVLAPRPAQLNHAAWDSPHLWDYIFPMFVCLSGIGLTFLFRRGLRWRRNLRRCGVLLGAGILYNVLAHPGPLGELRLFGPLQVYALLILLVGALHLWLRTARSWAVFTLVYSVVLGILWVWFSRSCPGGVPTPDCNPTLVLESRLVGLEHVYRFGERGYEPEGVVGSLGALASAGVGVTAGHVVRQLGRTPRAANVLLVWAGVVGLLGWGLTLLVPTVKWLWTPSYGLITAAAGLLLFVAALWFVDVGPWHEKVLAIGHPVRAIGRNSLLVYFGSHLLMIVLLTRGDPSWARQIADAIAPWGHERLTFALAILAFWWLLTLELDRRRLYLRA